MSAPSLRLPGGATATAWFVALVGVVLVGYVSLHALRTERAGSQAA